MAAAHPRNLTHTDSKAVTPISPAAQKFHLLIRCNRSESSITLSESLVPDLTRGKCHIADANQHMAEAHPAIIAAVSISDLTLFRRLSSGDHEFDDDASIQGLMVCVDGRNLDFVWSRRKTSDNDRPAAGFGPDPRRAINGYMEMPDAGRHIDRLRAKHRDDLQIFGAVLDEDDSAAQRFGQRRIDHDFCRRLRLIGLSDGVGRPRNGHG